MNYLNRIAFLDKMQMRKITCIDLLGFNDQILKKKWNSDYKLNLNKICMIIVQHKKNKITAQFVLLNKNEYSKKVVTSWQYEYAYIAYSVVTSRIGSYFLIYIVYIFFNKKTLKIYDWIYDENMLNTWRNCVLAHFYCEKILTVYRPAGDWFTLSINLKS